VRYEAHRDIVAALLSPVCVMNLTGGHLGAS
jgi:hypothetical protein